MLTTNLEVLFLQHNTSISNTSSSAHCLVLLSPWICHATTLWYLYTCLFPKLKSQLHKFQETFPIPSIMYHNIWLTKKNKYKKYDKIKIIHSKVVFLFLVGPFLSLSFSFFFGTASILSSNTYLEVAHSRHMFQPSHSTMIYPSKCSTTFTSFAVTCIPKFLHASSLLSRSSFDTPHIHLTGLLSTACHFERT